MIEHDKTHPAYKRNILARLVVSDVLASNSALTPEHSARCLRQAILLAMEYEALRLDKP